MRTLLSFLLLASPAFAAPASYVVRVRVDDGGGTHSLGSGTLVESDGRLGMVLTNSHVVRDGRGDITVEFTDGARHNAKLVAQDPEADLACLIICKPPTRPATLEVDEPQRGEALSIGGFGSTNTYRQAGGVLGGSSVNGRGEAAWCSVQGAGARSGDSGGPVFNRFGRMVGVLWGTDGGATYFVRLSCIRRFFGCVPVVWRVCPGGQCYPAQQQAQAPMVPVIRPPQQPPVAVNPPPIAEPPVAPPPVGAASSKPCDCDNAKLVALMIAMESRQTKLETLIAELATRSSVAGQAGPAGPKGEAGPPGLPGKDGIVDVTKVADEVERRLKGNLRVVMETLP